MTTPKTKAPRASLNQLAVPIGVVGIVVMMVVPIPTFLLDLLIAMNITFAVLVVLVSMYVSRPLEFSSFPSLLLIATLFRLALNISATRLVLSKGFAGNVINSFGHFVISGSLIVGLVIFAILLVIQFVVITNGAARVAEVGARFTLDAMPGKQMAIDADLNSGLINDKQARIRRREVAAEADFYGAMDGASRFVKGDAIAALIITFINLIGGFAIGVLSKHMPLSEALSSYSLMSVGDGLVSQIPALLLSVSTGLIVTRASDSDDMSTVVTRQLSSQLKALQIAGAAAVGLCLVPGLPKIPFLIVGGGLLVIASRVKQNGPPKAEETEAEAATVSAAEVPDTPEALLSQIMVEPLELMLSPDLISLVDGAGADLLDRVRSLRRSLAQELGVVMPPVRTRDSLDLPHATYAIRINGVEVARGQAPTGTVLAIGDDLDGLPGQVGHEPVFGLEGKWVPVELRGQAELLGATVVDRSSVIITHLSEAVRRNASRLLGREEVALATKSLKNSHPTVVEDLTPALLTLAEIQRVLHALLDEGIPIRDLVRIFEALALAAKSGTEPDRLIEAARNALAPAIVAEHSVDGHLDVLTLDPQLQQTIMESLRPGEGGPQLVLPPDLAESVVATARQRYTEATSRGRHPVLVCAPQLRLPLRRLMRMTVPEMPILSYTDISAGTARIDTVGVIEDVRNAVL
ncbi:flagellar biosynthesis protein FlhA [Jatrophihabitans sp. GAS493]|uniref:flagellar biosynthesis protein FlhA n=1 Tax=Jatrophihabitans sp. GAS493 TaxID=1907575 RepID=UPI000BB6D405|nr:flagellar biosynthesis protein FlhA [Jatrophihabitans sp. GAS493]SOD71312.1 flagellar biosynthesis protein FlhA [Jatrophihabitans sp. GAS493]